MIIEFIAIPMLILWIGMSVVSYFGGDSKTAMIVAVVNALAWLAIVVLVGVALG